MATGREIASFIQDKPVYWLAFSPDNQMLVWGGIGSYQVWRAPQGELLASSGFPKPPAADPPATSVWRVPDGDAPAPPRMLAEKNLCLTNLLKIHAAIMSYRKEHQQMPDELGDLVPKYLADANSLVCPVDAATTALPGLLPTADPKARTSYSYEFSARLNRVGDPYGLAAPGDTMKAWRTKQFARYGGVVPVVRCFEHGVVLNVSYAGELGEEGPQGWESAADVKWHAKDPAGAEEWYRKMEQEGNILALNHLAWRWATSGNPEQRDGRAAVRFAGRAVELTNRKAHGLMDTLSAAYAEAGQFEKATAAQLEAISLLNNAPRTSTTGKMLHDYQDRLELYRKQRPYREEF